MKRSSKDGLSKPNGQMNKMATDYEKRGMTTAHLRQGMAERGSSQPSQPSQPSSASEPVPDSTKPKS